ncbi:hypothetical protein Brsp06_03495 [Brucella sp. NBRC 13694]|uniref:hypothetical protein n=1 Tax=Brucella sp. NBRC 13694 TaxID=3075482 RepID=UPI0030A4FB54
MAIKFAKYAKHGVKERPNQTSRNKTVVQSFNDSLKKQIEEVSKAIKSPGTVKWNRGHWVKPIADDKYSVQVGFVPVVFEGDIKYFEFQDLDQVLAFLNDAKELVEDPAFVSQLEKIRADRNSGTKKKK